MSDTEISGGSNHVANGPPRKKRKIDQISYINMSFDNDDQFLCISKKNLLKKCQKNNVSKDIQKDILSCFESIQQNINEYKQEIQKKENTIHELRQQLLQKKAPSGLISPSMNHNSNHHHHHHNDIDNGNDSTDTEVLAAVAIDVPASDVTIVQNGHSHKNGKLRVHCDNSNSNSNSNHDGDHNSSLIRNARFVTVFANVKGMSPKSKICFQFYDTFVSLISQTIKNKENKQLIEVDNEKRSVVNYSDIAHIISLEVKDDTQIYVQFNQSVPINWRKNSFNAFAVVFELRDVKYDDNNEEIYEDITLEHIPKSPNSPQKRSANTGAFIELESQMSNNKEFLFSNILSTLSRKAIERTNSLYFQSKDKSYYIEAVQGHHKIKVFFLANGILFQPKPFTFIAKSKIECYNKERVEDGLRYFDLNLYLVDNYESPLNKKNNGTIQLTMISKSELFAIERYFNKVRIPCRAPADDNEDNDEKMENNNNKQTSNSVHSSDATKKKQRDSHTEAEDNANSNSNSNSNSTQQSARKKEEEDGDNEDVAYDDNDGLSSDDSVYDVNDELEMSDSYTDSEGGSDQDMDEDRRECDENEDVDVDVALLDLSEQQSEEKDSSLEIVEEDDNVLTINEDRERHHKNKSKNKNKTQDSTSSTAVNTKQKKSHGKKASKQKKKKKSKSRSPTTTTTTATKENTFVDLCSDSESLNIDSPNENSDCSNKSNAKKKKKKKRPNTNTNTNNSESQPKSKKSHNSRKSFEPRKHLGTVVARKSAQNAAKKKKKKKKNGLSPNKKNQWKCGVCKFWNSKRNKKCQICADKCVANAKRVDRKIEQETCIDLITSST